MKRLTFASLAATIVLTVSAAAPVTVTQKGLQFSVEELSLSKGQVVAFVNDDRTAHNITVTVRGSISTAACSSPARTSKCRSPSRVPTRSVAASTRR